MVLIWTDYMKYKARLREFDLVKIQASLGIRQNATLILKQGGKLL